MGVHHTPWKWGCTEPYPWVPNGVWWGQNGQKIDFSTLVWNCSGMVRMAEKRPKSACIFSFLVVKCIDVVSGAATWIPNRAPKSWLGPVGERCVSFNVYHQVSSGCQHWFQSLAKALLTVLVSTQLRFMHKAPFRRICLRHVRIEKNVVVNFINKID